MQDLYLSIRAHLEKTAPLWQLSVLDSWEQVQSCIPEEWFKWARATPHAGWHTLGLTPGQSTAPGSLRLFAQSSLDLYGLIPVHSKTIAIPPWFGTRLTPKKKHEIERLLGLLESAPPRQVIDIGGGNGHLARHVARAFGCNVDSIDMNQDLQAQGLTINESHHWRSQCDGKIQFHALKFTGELPSILRNSPNSPGFLSLGLHTCGPLAWRHLEHAAETRTRAINFGCCYELLDPMTDINRSRFCRMHPITHGEESLLLATRGGVQERLEDFEFQQRVLDYRYTLDSLLRQQGHAVLSRKVGTAPLALYRGGFETYARDRLKRLGLEESLYKGSEFKITEQQATQKVQDQRFASFVRNLVSRPLELSLLLDRALWNEEQSGLKTTLARVFEPSISPRNIAILTGTQALLNT